MVDARRGREVVGGRTRWREGTVLDRGGGQRRGESNRRWWKNLWQAQLSIGCDGGVDSELPLGYKVFEVCHDAAMQWVLCVDPLDTAEIAVHLGGALPEPHEAIVEKGTSVSIRRVGIDEPWKEGEGGSREEE